MAIDFYFSDLTPEAQQRLLKAQGLSCAEEGNYDMDILPIFTLETDDYFEDHDHEEVPSEEKLALNDQIHSAAARSSETQNAEAPVKDPTR